MKNVKKYKDGIIYNIITVNGSQPRPARRKRTTQPSKYNPQFRGMQYYAPLPSYADYGMNRFNTGNSQNTNIQDQYLREKVRELEEKLNPDNNLPMIENLQSQLSNLEEQQNRQQQHLINAGSYMMDFENNINDRFSRIKAPYSFDDSAGSFAETVDDNGFISQIGNDREDLEDFKNNDDDNDKYKSTVLTPVSRFENRQLENPIKSGQLQISNEPFFTSPIEEEKKTEELQQPEVLQTSTEPERPPTPPPQNIIKIERKPTPIEENEDEPYKPTVIPDEWFTFFNNAQEMREFQKKYPQFKYGEEDPREYLKKEPENIEEERQPENIEEEKKPENIEEEKKEITTEDIKIRPSTPIKVEDVEDDDEEDDDEINPPPKITRLQEINPPPKITRLQELRKEYQNLGGTDEYILKNGNISNVTQAINNLKRNLKESKKQQKEQELELNKLKKEYKRNGGIYNDELNWNNQDFITQINLLPEKKKYIEEFGGTLEDIFYINSLTSLELATKDKKLEQLNAYKEEYKRIGGNDNKILNSTSIKKIKEGLSYLQKLNNVKENYKLLERYEGYDRNILKKDNYDEIKNAYDALRKIRKPPKS